MAWHLQEAKQHLSEVVRQALENGPQVITRHGKEAVVVISIAEFERLRQGQPDFKEFLRRAPDLDWLPITRSRS